MQGSCGMTCQARYFPRAFWSELHNVNKCRPSGTNLCITVEVPPFRRLFSISLFRPYPKLVQSHHTCISMSFFTVNRAVAGPLGTPSVAFQQTVGLSVSFHQSAVRNSGLLLRDRRVPGVFGCPAVAYEADAAESLNDEAEDFYAILGVVSDDITMAFDNLKNFAPLPQSRHAWFFNRRGGWVS